MVEELKIASNVAMPSSQSEALQQYHFSETARRYGPTVYNYTDTLATETLEVELCFMRKMPVDTIKAWRVRDAEEIKTNAARLKAFKDRWNMID